MERDEQNYKLISLPNLLNQGFLTSEFHNEHKMNMLILKMSPIQYNQYFTKLAEILEIGAHIIKFDSKKLTPPTEPVEITFIGQDPPPQETLIWKFVVSMLQNPHKINSDKISGTYKYCGISFSVISTSSKVTPSFKQHGIIFTNPQKDPEEFPKTLETNSVLFIDILHPDEMRSGTKCMFLDNEDIHFIGFDTKTTDDNVMKIIGRGTVMVFLERSTGAGKIVFEYLDYSSCTDSISSRSCSDS